MTDYNYVEDSVTLRRTITPEQAKMIYIKDGYVEVDQELYLGGDQTFVL